MNTFWSRDLTRKGIDIIKRINVPLIKYLNYDHIFTAIPTRICHALKHSIGSLQQCAQQSGKSATTQGAVRTTRGISRKGQTG